MGGFYFPPTSYITRPRLTETPGPARKFKRANGKPKVKVCNFIKRVSRKSV